MKRQFLALACSLLAVSCGSSSSTPTAPAQTTPPPPANSAPSIVSMSVTPQFGIQSLTLFTFSANATDANSDPLTYTWDIAGASRTGSSTTGTFTSGGTGTATVTVTDGKGGSATDSRTFIVGTASGNWTGSGQGLGNFSMTLTQTAGFVTGTYQDPFGTGQIDPAQPGRIDGNGALQMRIKIGHFTDFNMVGTMDNTGRRVSGTLHGSGFTGQLFAMTK